MKTLQAVIAGLIIALALFFCVGGFLAACGTERNVVGTQPAEQESSWDGGKAVRNALCALGHTEFCDGPSLAPAPDFSGTVSWDDLDAEEKNQFGPYWLCSDPSAEIKFTCRWVNDGWQCTIDWNGCAGAVGSK